MYNFFYPQLSGSDVTTDASVGEDSSDSFIDDSSAGVATDPSFYRRMRARHSSEEVRHHSNFHV